MPATKDTALYHQDDDSPAGKVSPFLQKTYDLVDDQATDHIIRWVREDDGLKDPGRSFLVVDQVKLESQVLLKYFKHNHFTSFVRQLNTYGFKKIDQDHQQFKNEYFIEGKRKLLGYIKRNQTRAKTDQNTTQNNSLVAVQPAVDMMQQMRTQVMGLEQRVQEMSRRQLASDRKLQDQNQEIRFLKSQQQKSHQFIAMASNCMQLLLLQPGAGPSLNPYMQYDSALPAPRKRRHMDSDKAVVPRSSNTQLVDYNQGQNRLNVQALVHQMSQLANDLLTPQQEYYSQQYDTKRIDMYDDADNLQDAYLVDDDVDIKPDIDEIVVRPNVPSTVLINEERDDTDETPRKSPRDKDSTSPRSSFKKEIDDYASLSAVPATDSVGGPSDFEAQPALQHDVSMRGKALAPSAVNETADSLPGAIPPSSDAMSPLVPDSTGVPNGFMGDGSMAPHPYPTHVPQFPQYYNPHMQGVPHMGMYQQGMPPNQSMYGAAPYMPPVNPYQNTLGNGVMYPHNPQFTAPLGMPLQAQPLPHGMPFGSPFSAPVSSVGGDGSAQRSDGQQQSAKQEQPVPNPQAVPAFTSLDQNVDELGVGYLNGSGPDPMPSMQFDSLQTQLNSPNHTEQTMYKEDDQLQDIIDGMDEHNQVTVAS